MTIDVKEKQFENHIESILLENGYLKRTSDKFERQRALDSELFIQFLKESQPDSWKLLEEIHGSDLQDTILEHLEKELDEKGMIHVIRKGVKISDIHLDCAYFKPVSKLNPESQKQYHKNIFSIIRQARYSKRNENSLDLLLCLNGLPIATGEIKNPFTGQTYEDAIRQYQQDRDPDEKIFQFKKRTLVHFAIDPYQIHMTTKLNKENTAFLPFNKGKDGGAGNPESSTYPTSYLWTEIWQKNSWLEILSNFIEIQTIDQSPAPTKEILIFPRYHQLDAVLKLVETTKIQGIGNNYLIEHSTGSGKSNTIAWLAYKLFSLHENDTPIFDGVLVISDRLGIVNQLGRTIMQFEQTPGTVQQIEDSTMLAENLETSRKILISTQQKFPFAYEKITNLKGRNFAIIIDEAHSSQTGEGASKKVKEVLTTNLEEAAKIESELEESEEDIIDKISAEMKKRGPQKNLNYYAFTATPKAKTLKLFGKVACFIPEIKYDPFHKYTMKQAIDENFILDVLKNYTTYERFFKIVKTCAEDKAVEGKKASRALMKYIDSHTLNIATKSQVIVEHFKTHTLPKIGGLAKAMVVTSSRYQAFLYKKAIDEYVKQKGYEGINTLVAFSGTITDEVGNKHTECSINNTKTDEELRDAFDTPKYNILVVAEKYQTGYDQPLLHTMYVDKKLYGIKAVQTLSRLNRTQAGKTDTFVIDFQNKVEDIVEAFKPYYQGTSLIDKTDPNYLNSLYTKILSYDILKLEDINSFAAIFYKSRDDEAQGKLYGIMGYPLVRFNETDEKLQEEFKQNLVNFIESYSFLTQVAQFDDTDLETLFSAGKFFVKLIPEVISSRLPSLKGDVSLQWYKLEKTHEGDISLGKETKPIITTEKFGKIKRPDIITKLSEIIKIFNERFAEGVPPLDANKIVLNEWIKKLENDEELREIAKHNEFQDFLRKFNEKFREIMIGSLNENKSLVSMIFANEQLKTELVVAAAEDYHKWVAENNIPPITPGSPSENMLHFREAIRNCKGYLHWIDLYLGVDGLRILMLGLDQEKTKEVKLLTSLYKNEYQINERFLDEFKRFQTELHAKGISCEMKVIMTKNAYEKVAHDRYLIGQNITYNVPSFTTVVKGRFSEIKRTKAQVPFSDYWNNSDTLDIVKEWDMIKQKHDQTQKLYPTNCTTCGKKIEVPFIPDGVRPVYCHDCNPKHK
ncbi:Helicase, type I site-specific restriction-modification system restriction subunit [Nitrosotalea devaniterrae]|uniref:Helicase, type I site-specific restriction-modification system restriction subunit n=1 Tax=Nitrosotalea devaniterrae TaxID=1078905 RepID=A0A128A1V4_9ARCH|nr:Helicase, type I site-specific restriction-modification system restriction subunit [Candidatus Nitrosotalea devanaterra]